MSNLENFAKMGRPRPPYKPIPIQCPKCGAPLEIKSEHTKLSICSHCGSNLHLSNAEIKILGSNIQNNAGYKLDIGSEFYWEGFKYEVIGRMAFMEDNDSSIWELTREYLLFNPRKGTLWLSEYQNKWQISWSDHVVINEKFGDKILTSDNKMWSPTESGVYSLFHVDGSLPWIAKVGDDLKYSEYISSTNREIWGYTISKNEFESFTGLNLTKAEIRSSCKLIETEEKSPENYLPIVIVSAISLVVCVSLLILSLGSGELVLDQSFSKNNLTNTIISESFDINKKLISIELSSAELDNAWMALDMAILKSDEDTVIHVDDFELSYYHGVDGGEAWTEGKIRDTIYLKIPDPGKYHVALHAISNVGETETSGSSQHEARVRVKQGVIIPYFPFIGTGVSLVFVVIFSYLTWRKKY